MSVQTEIDRISTAVQNAHLKVIEKGGTSAAPYLVANLPDAIDTIPEATEPKLQAKSATPSETAQTVKPDSGYDGLSQVSVGAISKTYVGSGVPKQAAKTITPSTSSQTAVASGVYTTGAVTVGAIPSTYVKPTATKAAATYTPSTSNQTIAAGTYCSGAQTIKGDANLVAGNIKSGVSIFGVAGTMTAGEDVTAETNAYTGLLDGLEAVVNALPDAGSGGGGGTNTLDAFMPTNTGIISGSYTPTTSGTDVKHAIQIGSSYTSAATIGSYPVLMFAIIRKDGFNATGSSSGRNIVAYIGMKGGGAVSYRNGSASAITYAGGAETTTTYNYGVGSLGATGRTNAYFRYMDNAKPIVYFSTYGIVALEANKEYTWLAVYDKTLMNV